MSSAPAKVILFGEHAVVYGKPAIAIPVSGLRAYADIQETGDPFQIIARNLDNKVINFDGDDPLVEVMKLVLDALDKREPQITMTIRSDIPIASGLGSGAAISTAIVRALASYFGISLADERINGIVYQIEKIHHGTPSGIDNTVIVYEQPVYFVRDMPIERLQNKTPLQILIGDTGKTALTKIAVGDVRRLYEDNAGIIEPALDKIDIIVGHARQAIETGNPEKLGKLMLENHALLQQLTVSSDELDTLVDAAMSAGALGAKLSGGGRGGNMIALVDENPEKVTEALIKAGAVRVFSTKLEATG